jgi:DNA-directed RNA polymerase alpha subunit
MRYYRPNPSLEVSAAIGHLRLQGLPVSTRLELVLKGLGIERLGHLNGVPVRELLRTRNCGSKTLAELKAILRRAEAGEFTFTQRELATQVPAGEEVG